MQPGVAAVVIDVAECRSFFRQFFSPNNLERLRIIVAQWIRDALVPNDTNKSAVRLADLFENLFRVFLDDAPAFCITNTHWSFFGSFHVPYALMSSEEIQFISKCVAQRESLFGVVKECTNMELALSQFCYDRQVLLYDNSVYDNTLARIVMREACDLLCEAGPKSRHEVIAALQAILRRSADLFVLALHDAAQSVQRTSRVPCWGLDAHDLHPEAVYQKSQPYPAFTN